MEAIRNTTTETRETIFLHTNSTTFITGETLYCKTYCLNPDNYSPSLISRIAYIELVDNTKKTVFTQKLHLENGMGRGDFFIPTTLKTGNYKLVAYTQWMRNLPEFANVLTISVVNPFQPLEKNGIVADANVSSNVLSSVSFALTTDKKTYPQRDKVRLNIKALQQNGKGNYSVSVRKTDALPTKNPPNATAFHLAESKKDRSYPSLTHLPELRGELLSGKIISKKGSKDLNHKTVALSIIGKTFAVKIAETDKEGRFTFILDREPNLSEIVVQLIDDKRFDYAITIDEHDKPDWSTLKFDPEAALNPALKTEIEVRSVASQIENAYYEQKKDSIAQAQQSDAFFHSNEKEYVLDDYTRFPTMKETITEVLNELYFTRKDGKYAINLRNYVTNNEGFGYPLLLVDGLVIQDANELFDYNPENIYKFSIINEPYVLGPKTFSGVINISTKNQDYQTKAKGDFIKKIETQRPLDRKFYFSPNYTQQAKPRIPDYRYQLLWEPTLTLEKMESEISFYTSDVPGKFEIVLEGFTHKGLPVSVKEFIEVK